MPPRFRHRDALRVLYILVAGSEELSEPHTSGASRLFRGEARLHAFDFWMRYPDYLAEELIDVSIARSDLRYLSAAARIFEDDEPDVRRIPMIRYRFGAYERLDDTLSLLTSRQLVRLTGTKAGQRVLETDFLVMPSALKLADEVVAEFPVLKWYADRAALVAEVAGTRGGGALKQRQYEQCEYAETAMGGTIPPIADRVRERLARILPPGGVST